MGFENSQARRTSQAKGWAHWLRVLETQLYKKTKELASARHSLQREQVYAKRLKRSLECQICQAERWDTVTGCGHLAAAECIKKWLEVNSAWVEDDKGYLVLREPRCLVCRVVLSAQDLKRAYV